MILQLNDFFVMNIRCLRKFQEGNRKDFFSICSSLLNYKSSLYFLNFLLQFETIIRTRGVTVVFSLLQLVSLFTAYVQRTCRQVLNFSFIVIFSKESISNFTSSPVAGSNVSRNHSSNNHHVLTVLLRRA